MVYQLPGKGGNDPTLQESLPQPDEAHTGQPTTAGPRRVNPLSRPIPPCRVPLSRERPLVPWSWFSASKLGIFIFPLFLARFPRGDGDPPSLRIK